MTGHAFSKGGDYKTLFEKEGRRASGGEILQRQRLNLHLRIHLGIIINILNIKSK
jgi:hypothetical protein